MFPPCHSLRYWRPNALRSGCCAERRAADRGCNSDHPLSALFLSFCFSLSCLPCMIASASRGFDTISPFFWKLSSSPSSHQVPLESSWSCKPTGYYGLLTAQRFLSDSAGECDRIYEYSSGSGHDAVSETLQGCLSLINTARANGLDLFDSRLYFLSLLT